MALICAKNCSNQAAPPAPRGHRASDHRHHSHAAPHHATPRAPRGLPATRTTAGYSTALLWATPGAVLALWGRGLPRGALLGPQCLADSAARTFPPVVPGLHLLLPDLIAYHSWEDLPFAFQCVFLKYPLCFSF